MSILDALRLQKSEQNSVRDLAMLPQAQIVQLAQMGQIPADVVPIIISEKARMAQQAAQMQAAQQQPQPTVIERAMAQNAQAETPMTGVASIPTQMFQQQNYANGGIVAFDDGGSVSSEVRSVKNPITDQSENEFIVNAARDLENAKIRAALIKRLGQPVVAQLMASGALGDGEGSIGAIGTPKELQALMAGYQREALGGRVGANLSVPIHNPRAPQLGLSYMRRFQAGGSTDPFFARTEETPEYTAPGPAVGSIDAYIQEAQQRRLEARKPTEAMLALERSLVDPASLASMRKEARDMALLQAGLGILGGTSKYGLENIGRGAAGAVESYGKQIGDIRRQEQQGISQRAMLDMKKQEQALADIAAGESAFSAARKEALEERKLTSAEERERLRAESAERRAELRNEGLLKAITARPDAARAGFVNDYVAGKRASGDERPEAILRMEGQQLFNANEDKNVLARATLIANITSDVDRIVAKLRDDPSTADKRALQAWQKDNPGKSIEDYYTGIKQKMIQSRYEQIALNTPGMISPSIGAPPRPAPPPAQPAAPPAQTAQPRKPDIANVQGAPAGSTIGKLTDKGWEVVKDGKVIGHVGE